jgi:hypothetical protein
LRSSSKVNKYRRDSDTSQADRWPAKRIIQEDEDARDQHLSQRQSIRPKAKRLRLTDAAAVFGVAGDLAEDVDYDDDIPPATMVAPMRLEPSGSRTTSKHQHQRQRQHQHQHSQSATKPISRRITSTSAETLGTPESLMAPKTPFRHLPNAPHPPRMVAMDAIETPEALLPSSTNSFVADDHQSAVDVPDISVEPIDRSDANRVGHVASDVFRMSGTEQVRADPSHLSQIQQQRQIQHSTSSRGSSRSRYGHRVLNRSNTSSATSGAPKPEVRRMIAKSSGFGMPNLSAAGRSNRSASEGASHRESEISVSASHIPVLPSVLLTSVGSNSSTTTAKAALIAPRQQTSAMWRNFAMSSSPSKSNQIPTPVVAAKVVAAIAAKAIVSEPDFEKQSSHKQTDEKNDLSALDLLSDDGSNDDDPVDNETKDNVAEPLRSDISNTATLPLASASASLLLFGKRNTKLALADISAKMLSSFRLTATGLSAPPTFALDSSKSKSALSDNAEVSNTALLIPSKPKATVSVGCQTDLIGPVVSKTDMPPPPSRCSACPRERTYSTALDGISMTAV